MSFHITPVARNFLHFPDRCLYMSAIFIFPSEHQHQGTISLENKFGVMQQEKRICTPP